ncbi:hypothetical protein MMC14_006537 [Varicellaria rhodocarpa]|nr:hypothetical protein [Varicellaria rhodocarpa]
MLFKSMTFAVLTAAVSVVAQEMSGADMVSNINRLTDLTRIATLITQDAVYVNNPTVNRNVTVSIIDAIGTQGTLDQDAMTGQACGALTKRHSGSIVGRAMLDQRQSSTTYTPEEQTNVASAYTTLVDVTQAFMAACVQKHYAVVTHNAAHLMGQALNSTLGVLDTMTDTVMTMVPTQKDAMTAQKGLLDQSYSSTVDLYVNGPL